MSLYEKCSQPALNLLSTLQTNQESKNPDVAVKKFVKERHRQQEFSTEFLRTVITLDNSHVKNKQVKGKCKKRLTAKQKRELKIYDISQSGKYEDFLVLNSIWCDYFRSVVKGFTESINKVEQSEFHATLLKADYYGCILSVTRSKCPSYVGISGILLQETRNSLKIITTNGLKVIPKMNSVFTFEFDGITFTIYGNNFRVKPSERAVRRFKSKSTIDL